MYEISIIIPTYKPQAYLFECLESIKKQVFSKSQFEIVIILNGDKEPYYAMIQGYIKSELAGYKVVLLYTDITGVSNARNMGIERSQGRYIAFIDDDDIISDNYLQGLYSVAIHGIFPLAYTLSFYNTISDSKEYYITRIYEKNQKTKLHVINTRSLYSAIWCKLIDRELIGDVRFNTHLQNGEDTVFMFSISNRVKKMQFTDKTAIYYYRRKRSNSLSTKKRTLKNNFKNCFYSIYLYLKQYIQDPLGYNFIFFVSRILACFRIFWMY